MQLHLKTPYIGGFSLLKWKPKYDARTQERSKLKIFKNQNHYKNWNILLTYCFSYKNGNMLK